MATCSIGTLITEACASGFTCLDPQTSRGVELALWQNIGGDTSSFGELFEQACDNNFVCLPPALQNAVILQLLCNLTEG